MAINIAMPKLGLTMEEGTFDMWLVAVGDKVKKGDPIAEISTDKITNIIESPADGILSKKLVKEGDVVAVGSPIGILAAEGEQIKDLQRGVNTKIAEFPKKMIKATPIAKKIAKEYHIDLSIVTGTGPGSRIREGDVKKFIESREIRKHTETSVKNYLEREKIVGIRKIIAERMQQSWTTIPHVTEHIKTEITKLADLRDEINKKVESKKITYTDLIAKLVIEAIKENKLVNAAFEGDEIVIYPYINLGIAVATEKGLIVPVIKNVEKLAIFDISEKIGELSEKARNQKLDVEELQSGTFTITNLGMYDIDSFTPIIYPGQVSILGVNKIYESLKLVDGKVQSIKTMKLSFSFDHRVIDGVVAAIFLNNLKQRIEAPLRDLIK